MARSTSNFRPSSAAAAPAARWALAAAFCAATSIAVVAAAAEPRAVTLLRDHRCYVCHDERAVLAGPAFVDISAFYRNDPHAAANIAASIRRGVRGASPWHMPPHPEVSAQDAAVIARYILSLEPRKKPAPPASSLHPASI